MKRRNLITTGIAVAAAKLLTTPVIAADETAAVGGITKTKGNDMTTNKWMIDPKDAVLLLIDHQSGLFGSVSV